MLRFFFAAAIAIGALLGSYAALTPSQPAWAARSPASLPIRDEPKPLSATEAKKIELHLRAALGIPKLRLEMQSVDADVMIGDRFIGVVYPDEDEGERTFYFEMAISSVDLDRTGMSEKPAR
jgi:hypothetical protein